MPKFQRIQAGQSFRPSAETWNALVEASKAYWQRQGQPMSAGEALPPDLPGWTTSNIVRVRNDTGQDIPSSAILGIDEPLFPAGRNRQDALRRVTLKGVTPTPDHQGKFVVTREPILRGQIGWAWVSGICPVRIDKTSDRHTRCEIVSSSVYHVRSASHGSAQLVHAEDGDGVVWGLIRLGADESASDPSNSGGGCGCCDRSNCQSDLFPTDGTICTRGPRYWMVDFGPLACGDCDDGAFPDGIGGRIKLYHFAGDVWKTTPGILCYGTTTIPGDCEKTAHWTWSTTTTTCADFAGCVYGPQTPGSYATSNWLLLSDDCDPLYCDGCNEVLTPNVPFGSIPFPTSADDRYFANCADSGSVSGIWVQSSTDNPDCDCTPPYPSGDGSSAGDTTTTTCNGIASTSTSGSVYSYWVLTVGEPGTYGDNATRLQLIIGNEVVLSYRLPWGRDWCCECENEMELEGCGPWPCSGVPSKICVKPISFDSEEDDNELISASDAPAAAACCLDIAEHDNKLPRYYKIKIDYSGSSAAHASPFWSCLAESEGSFVAEFKTFLGDAYWEYVADNPVCGTTPSTGQNVKFTRILFRNCVCCTMDDAACLWVWFEDEGTFAIPFFCRDDDMGEITQCWSKRTVVAPTGSGALFPGVVATIEPVF